MRRRSASDGDLPVVPERRVVGAVSGRLATLRERRGRHASPNLCDEVRELVVVCSSSRSGSTLLASLLRASPDLIGTSAEINPQLVIPVLGRGCDAIADPSPDLAAGPAREVGRSELSLDLGRPSDATRLTASDDRALEVLADHLAWRLTMQWPHEPIDPDHVADLVHRHAPLPADDTERFRRLLPGLRDRYPTIDPRRYDAADALRHVGVAPGDPVAPPPEPIVEMAPFVLPRYWDHATAEQARTLPTVLVTPRNAFRVPVLASLFPRARLRLVHLVRNPAASINGLRDGWHHPDFTTCQVPGGLAIGGYSEVHPERGDRWCFDLPPGWRDHTTSTLEETCAFQWRAAHQATLTAGEALQVERHVVRFEDVVGPPERRRASLGALADFLDIDATPLVTHEQLPVVMATATPRPGRWRAQEGALDRVLRDPELLRVTEQLGYALDRSTWT